MKKLQISLCTLLTLGCISQSAEAMFSRDQLSTQALALRNQAATYLQSHPTETKAFGAAGILAAAALYKYSTRAPEPKRGIRLASYYDGNILRGDIIGPKLQNGNHKDCLTELPKALGVTDYRDLIKEGGRVFNQIQTNPETSIDTKDIVQLSWFLYSLTMYKNQDFSRGMMVIEDNDDVIYNYLKHYVKSKNPNAENSFFKKASLFNSYAYERYSTHFPKNKTRQYGIDIRLDASGKRFAVLPGGQTHLLFGKAAKDLTFIKFERDGLYILDGWVQHVLTAIAAVGRKLPICGGLFGSNDLESSSKEHMPSDIKKDAAKLDRNEETISALMNACKKNSRKYKNLINTIKYKYPFLADEKKRFGNEAIITEQALTFSKYYDNPITTELEGIYSTVDYYQRVSAGQRS
jgi:hypothetical protein